MQYLGNLNAAQILNHLKSMNFPCSKGDIVNKMQELGVSPDQMSLIQKIADRQYGSPHEVMAEVKSFL